MLYGPKVSMISDLITTAKLQLEPWKAPIIINRKKRNYEYSLKWRMWPHWHIKTNQFSHPQLSFFTQVGKINQEAPACFDTWTKLFYWEQNLCGERNKMNKLTSTVHYSVTVNQNETKKKRMNYKGKQMINWTNSLHC